MPEAPVSQAYIFACSHQGSLLPFFRNLDYSDVWVSTAWAWKVPFAPLKLETILWELNFTYSKYIHLWSIYVANHRNYCKMRMTEIRCRKHLFVVGASIYNIFWNSQWVSQAPLLDSSFHIFYRRLVNYAIDK